MSINTFSSFCAAAALSALSIAASFANEPDAKPAGEVAEAGTEVSPLIGELKILLEQIESSGETLELVEKAADLYLRLGDAQRAVALYQRAIERHGAPERVYVKLARTMQLAGRPELGVEVLKVAQQAMPDSAALHFELGQAYNAQGKHYAAASALNRAMALDPSDTAYPFHLAIALRSQKKYAEALALVDGLLEKGAVELPIKLVRGELLVASGSESAAVGYAEELFREAPQERDVKLLLAHAYSRLALREGQEGRGAAAIQILEKAIGLDLGIPELRFQIATLRFEAGEYLEAQEQASLAIQAAPDSLSAYVVSGAALKALERTTEAREVLQKGLLRARAAKDEASIKYFEQLLRAAAASMAAAP